MYKHNWLLPRRMTQALAATSLEQGFVKDHRDKAEALLTAAQLAHPEVIRDFCW
jgi:hypothetical protein